MTSPSTEYQRRIAAGLLQPDPAQPLIVAHLDRLFDELIADEERRRSVTGRLGRLLGKGTHGVRHRVRGLYIWGSVGRGKTLLMDLFFHCLPFAAKKRQHFHRFMAAVHRRLKSLRDEENPLELVADQIAAECRIICFDEFAVSDIADAMILGNLFSALFERGVTLAATSNIAPSDLYRDGLQRQRFLPAIEAIEAHTKVLQMGGDRDYRLGVLEGAAVYLTPAGTEANTQLEASFAAIAPDQGDTNGSIEILGRAIDFIRSSEGVIWFDFDAICDGPRSQDDYIELAREFQTVLVSNVPVLDANHENQARRFVALIDEFYDRKVKLILSAAAPPAALYTGTRLAQVFERTQSRLMEMQSHAYLALAHRA